MIVIAAHSLEPLQRLLQSLVEHRVTDEPITVVNTGNDALDLTPIAQDYPSLNIAHILKTGKTYDTGAYITAYRNAKAPYYMFLQDTCVCNTSDPLRPYLDKIRFCDVVSFRGFISTDDWADYAPLKNVLQRTLGHDNVARYRLTGVFGPIFFTRYETMNVLDRLGYLHESAWPRFKEEACSWEWLWSILFQHIGRTVEPLGCYRELSTFPPETAPQHANPKDGSFSKIFGRRR